jgi:uncharacterized protein (TIGR02145 family)
MLHFFTNSSRLLFFGVFFLCVSFSQLTFGQLTIVQGSAMNMTPEELVANYLIGSGVSISNVTYNGTTTLIDSDQIGTFETGGEALNQLGIAEGILMTSGEASIAIGPNSQTGAGTGVPGSFSDPDLAMIAGTTIDDACILEFDFVPESDTIQFRYVFASEEFYDYCNSINDAFGFFLSGPGINGPYTNNAENIALLPGGTLPVTINNMCADQTTNWCNTNNGNGYQLCNEQQGLYFEYDGLSFVFTAWYVVTPCTTYHIKLAVGDAVDQVFDSGVFLEKNSFSSVGVTVNTTFTIPSLGERAIEGCSNAMFNVVTPAAVSVPTTIYYNILGTAVNGVDYTEIPDSVVIATGQTTGSITIQPLYDGITEGPETVILEFMQAGCSGNQTMADTIYIHDNTPFYVDAGVDDTICALDSATLEGTAWGGQRPFDYNWEGIGGHDSIVKVSPPPGSHEYVLLVEDGCGVEERDTMQLVVKPLPAFANTDLVDTICSGSTTSIALESNLPDSSFSWTSANLSGQITGHGPGTGDSILQTLVNLDNQLDSVRYIVLPVANGCPGPDTVFTVFVNPEPDVLFAPVNKQELCHGQATEIVLSSHVQDVTFSWTVTPLSTTSSGFSAGTGDTIQQILYTTILQADSLYYHVSAEINGCQGPVFDYLVIIHPMPVMTLDPMYDSICSNDVTDIVLTSTCNGTSYQWTAAQGVGNVTGFSDGMGDHIQHLLINHDPGPGSVVYSITASTPTCTAADTTFVEWVKYRPLLTNNPPETAICNNTSPNITLTSDLTGTEFIWTCTPSSGNVTGWSDNAVPTTLLDQTLVNSGYDIETVTYHITPVSEGCQGTPTDFTVTVYPTPDLSNTPPDTAICSGSNTGLPLRSNINGTLYTWTCTASSANVTGWSDNPTPTDTIFQNLINTGFDIETVTYSLTPEANGCNGAPVNYTVTVYPVPDLSTTPLIKEICNNQPTDISLLSHVTGSLFSWTASGTNGNITGFSNSTAPAITIDQTLTNSSSANDTVIYTITPEANGCYGLPVDYKVSVVPSPYLSNMPQFHDQCNNTNTNLTLTSNVPGTQFTWICTPSSANISGYSNSTVPGTLIDQTLINNGFDVETVIYHIDPENSGCPGSTTDYTVTIVPEPDVYFDPGSDAICSGTTANIDVLSHVPAATFTWTAVASSANISGHADGSGPLIQQTLVNSGTTIETVTYTATPEAFNCTPGTPQNMVVTVFPRPAASATPNGDSICSGTQATLSLAGDVPGATFAWRAFSGIPEITGYSNGNGNTIIQTLSNSGYTTDSAMYRIAATANGCTGDSITIPVTVFPVADVLFTPQQQELCSGETAGISILSNVGGTSFSWTASGSSPEVSGYSNGSGDLIQQTLFNSGYLMPEVTYQVIPEANGCTGTMNSATVTVNPLPVVNFTPCFDTITTTNAQPIWLSGGIPRGGNYTGTTVNTRQFFPAIAGPGTHEIKYTYTNDFGCIDSASVTIFNFQFSIFNCGDSLTDPRDSTRYPTVEIGTQCWMAANLNYGNTVASAQIQRDNCINEKYCIDDNPANCNQYGGLYSWNEVMGYRDNASAQGLCPPGWHIPTESEWNTLFNQYVSNGFAGNALKYSGLSGFNALLEGIRLHNLVWKFTTADGILNSSMYWSSTSWGLNKAWAHGINDVVADREYTPSMSFYPATRNHTFLVRCIKD